MIHGAGIVVLFLATLLAVCARQILLEPGIQPIPAEWTKVRPASEDSHVWVVFAVKQPEAGVKRLSEVFNDVTNPSSDNYGKYLSIDELTSLLAPSQASLEEVTRMLDHHQVSYKIHRNRDLISANITKAQALCIFDVELSVFKHTSGQEIVRSDRLYSLPHTVAAVVDFVEGLTRFPSTPTLQVTRTPIVHHRKPVTVNSDGPVTVNSDWPDDCGCWDLGHGAITPAVLRMRYNISDSVAGQSANNSLAVAEFQGQYYSPDDLSKFQTQCKVSNDPVAKLVGDNVSWLSGTESTLDIEYIMAVAQKVPAWFWSHSTFNLYEWITAVEDTEGAPWIHSVSYGNDEVQNSQPNMLRTNIEFQKIGVRGISILFASGDQGVWGRSGDGKRFHPDFPGASPYITAVGGTQFIGDVIGEEVGTAWSGGGFSDLFERPSYQDDAVKRYLNSPDADLPPASYWNASGRGYPDVSALCGQGHHYCLVHRNLHSYVMGTSASAPVVAGIFALLNDIRLQKGEPPLGFLNPWIYQTAVEHPGGMYCCLNNALNNAFSALTFLIAHETVCTSYIAGLGCVICI
eukprot:TRINITY_DN979_c0_g1_i2.p1 TRINITY_DN979_c0_g1~~TRINITY_DN979_c0_g1_i2.p1  ORF type:complete len:573 (-),score=84.76 TRINITY_DN979_c0_g1_i2:335-2053(-)